MLSPSKLYFSHTSATYPLPPYYSYAHRSRRNDVNDLLWVPLREQPIRQLVRLSHLSLANRPHPEEAAHELAMRVSRNGRLQFFDRPVGDGDVFALYLLEGLEDLVVGLPRRNCQTDEKLYISSTGHKDQGGERNGLKHLRGGRPRCGKFATRV